MTGFAANSPCPFCNPTVLKTQTVFDGHRMRVIYNYKPGSDYHLMVIPKRHIEHFSELSQREILEMKDITDKINQVYIKKLNIDNFIIIQKNGNLTGRTVEHVHFHTVPVYDDYKAVIRKTFDIDRMRDQVPQHELLAKTKLLRSLFHQIG